MKGPHLYKMKTLTVFILLYLTECCGRVIRSGEDDNAFNTPMQTGQSDIASGVVSDRLIPSPNSNDEKTNSTPKEILNTGSNSGSGETLAQKENGRELNNVMPSTGISEKHVDHALNTATQNDISSVEAEKDITGKEILEKQSEKTEIVNPGLNSNTQINKDLVKSEPSILPTNQNTGTLPETSNTETKTPDNNGEGTKLDDSLNILMPGPVMTKQNTNIVPTNTETKVSDVNGDGLKLEDIPNIMMPGPVIINEEPKKVSPTTYVMTTEISLSTLAKDAEEAGSLQPDLETAKQINEEHPIDATETKDESISQSPSKDIPNPEMKDVKTNEAPTQVGTNVNSLTKDNPLDSGKKYTDSIMMPGPVMIDEKTKSSSTENKPNFDKDKTHTQLTSQPYTNENKNQEGKISSSIQSNSGTGNQLDGNDGIDNKPLSNSIQAGETDNNDRNDVLPVTLEDKSDNEDGKKEPNADGLSIVGTQNKEDNDITADLSEQNTAKDLIKITVSTPINDIDPTTSYTQDDGIDDALIKPTSKEPETNMFNNDVFTGSTLDQEEGEHGDDKYVDDDDKNGDINDENEDYYEYTDDYDENWWEDDDYSDDAEYDDDDDDDEQSYSDESIVDLDDIAEEEEEDDDDDNDYMTDDDYITDDDNQKDDEKFGEIITNVKTPEDNDENDVDDEDEYMEDDDNDDNDDEGREVINGEKEENKFDIFNDLPSDNNESAKSDDNNYDDDVNDSNEDDVDDDNDDVNNDANEDDVDDANEDDDDNFSNEIENTHKEEGGTSDVDDTDFDSKSDTVKSSKHTESGAEFRDDKKWREITSEVKRASTYSWVLFFAVIVITLLFVAYLNKSKVQKYFAPAAPSRRKVGDEEKNLLAYEYD